MIMLIFWVNKLTHWFEIFKIKFKLKFKLKDFDQGPLQKQWKTKEYTL